jgi:DNA-directed RNA polymerase subunit F
MIIEKKPLTLAEVKEIVSKKSKESKEETKQNARLESVNILLKKFVKLTPDQAKKLREELASLNIIKLKEKDIVKIINFLPEDAEDLRKIFFGQGINLDENEINSILEKVKKYR